MTMSIVKGRRRPTSADRAAVVARAPGARSHIRTIRPVVLRHLTSLLARKFQSMSRAQRIRVWLFSALSIISVWLVIASTVAYRSDNALPINPDLDDNTSPVESVASDPSESLDSDVDPTTPSVDQISAAAERVLVRNPLSAHALRILGQVAAAAGDAPRANAFFQAAARRSLRETPALYWLMKKNYEQDNFATVIDYADALLRTRPRLIKVVTPVLARMLENESARPQLQKLLADNPPWRASFLAAFPAYIADARISLNLFLNLRDSSPPLTLDELSDYLAFLLRNNLYEFAYYAWLQFLPPELLTKVGFLINGSFERIPSGFPFDWVIKSGPGVTVGIDRNPTAKRHHALFIEFGQGRADFAVSQLVALPPGTFQFEGQYMGELKGRRGLVWRITCANDGKRIGQSDMMIGVVPIWADFGFSFTVPDRNCRAQVVQLMLNARSDSERLVSGSVWYDNLKISRSQDEVKSSNIGPPTRN
jgi:hypothetical protein